MRYRKLLLVAIFTLLSFSAQSFAQASNSVSTNQFEGLEFDEEEIFVPCPGVKSSLYFTTDELLGVSTKTAGQTEKLKFKYTVSGGRIVGKGANVDWDLRNLRIGKYKISVNV